MKFQHLSVYVACALTHATEAFKQQVEELKRRLERFCYLNCFLGVGTGAEPSRVYTYDIACVDQSQLVVAICNSSSTGLGMEAQRQIDRHGAVLAVAQREASVSPMIQGPPFPGFEYCLYDDLLQEVPAMVLQRLEEIDSTPVGEVARKRYEWILQKLQGDQAAA